MEKKSAEKYSPKSKWRFIWILPVAALSISACLKVFKVEFMYENMANAGMGHMTSYLGYVSLACVVVFLIPKTRLLGFLLLTAYIGGIIVAHWIAKDGNVIGIILQSLLWVGAYFEFKELVQVNKMLKLDA